MALGPGVIGLGGPLGSAYALVPGPLGLRPELRHPVLDQLLPYVVVHVTFLSCLSVLLGWVSTARSSWMRG